MGNNPGHLTSLKWYCWCGAEITSTDDGDGKYVTSQCTEGHSQRKERNVKYQRPHVKRPSWQKPPDSAA